MYDKDILVLHNFRTETTNQLTKLQKDIDTILRSAGNRNYQRSKRFTTPEITGLES